MNILIIGSGGREHALAWKIAQSPLVDTVWSAPGSVAMDQIGPCFDVAADDIDGLQALALQLEPDLIVIGPEAPLALGLADLLRARGFDVFGPSRDAAQLEASKGFAKDMMARFGVPTAAYGAFTDLAKARAFLDTMNAPYVLKADGLAAGKGVVIAQTREEAESELSDMLSGKFGDASASVVIEEFMEGEEASVFVLTDGTNALTLPAVQDHKRVGEGDTGPNTGGMGAYAPAPLMTPELMATVDEQIARPMLDGMRDADMAYSGVLYIGIMVTAQGPKVVEFNCRFGDPECQALMVQTEADIVPALLSCATGGMPARDFARLLPQDDRPAPTVTVVMASEGYPGSYEKHTVIKGLKEAGEVDGVTIFHAGTGVNDAGDVVATGGRVLNVTATGATLQEAVDRAYAAVDRIDWAQGFCRRDIAWRAL
ncbi:phosphoribosylamine--glycine ligase [Marinicauda pacifica]|jgi:phosphoribosylamine---glycine ligase|uniref:Phosphoribosylamine--glycine ligase n=1 Tax=Marinicauda pacifica TaxID=1133559 RepID=A0A4V3RZE6_9PROT|nr:phosphoribosylamine--glycine ligase [Marinicauda pacifica]TGY93959.1 phosphoribosylamine--glycine ligase [Marinicauda pacifica]GGE31727.1 phosphoribosylamine--glycine ligase [Marinicauda pacifica]